jgi:hypothetical protein
MLAPRGVLNQYVAFRASTDRGGFLAWIIDDLIWAILELVIYVILDGAVIIATVPVIVRIKPGSLAIPAKILFFI